MEKVSIKSKAEEIVIRSESEKGLSEVFSYDFNGNSNIGTGVSTSSDSDRKLGSLFLIGHIQPEAEETSYIISLIASLAKREYYSSSNLHPKEAFSRALKKINEALEDFFSDKEASLNIGVFAAAGENIYISRLGKFKIILSRKNNIIDVLNNINLFDKEHIQEKEFSSIISGRVTPGDKILAFYPNRAMTLREKVLGAYLGEGNGAQFVQKLATLKVAKPNFSCAAIHISIDKHLEKAVSSTISPRSLKGHKAVNMPDTILASSKEPLQDKGASKENADENNKDAEYKEEEEQEAPLIIPSEFSSAKKSNILSRAAILISNSTFLFSKFRQGNMQKRLVLFSFLAILVLGSYFTISFFFIKDPAVERMTVALNEAQANIKLAKTKITQNDLAEARRLLASSILSLSAIGEENDKIRYQETQKEAISVLDGIDKATEASLSLAEPFDEAVAYKKSLARSLKEKISASTYGTTTSNIDFDLYQDNLYMLNSDSIYKVSDAIQGKDKSSIWLAENSILPADPLLIAVDGDIFILTRSGILTKYFKGIKEIENNINIKPSNDSRLLTTADSGYLYLIDKALARIYKLDKESGAVVKTLKISTLATIIDAYISNSEDLYIETQDNKIWQVSQ